MITEHLPAKKLPGLDGLRAIAACIVLVGHVYQICSIKGYKGAGDVFPYFSMAMKTMVNLFFVISGFIITYLLYEEKMKAGSISILHFYRKRILRIWPLYFFVFGAVFLTDPCLRAVCG